MLALFKRTVFALLALLTGTLLIEQGPQHEPWQTLIGCVFGLGALVLVYCICDAIQLGMQRLGRSRSSFTIQTHVGAGLLLLLGMFIGHGDPSLEGTARWVLAISLPMTLYLYWGFWAVVGRIIDRQFRSDSKPARRTRKH